jgi:hypothetical protein
MSADTHSLKVHRIYYHFSIMAKYKREGTATRIRLHSYCGGDKQRLPLHASPMPSISEYNFSQVPLW